jgi:hypothetical protein
MIDGQGLEPAIAQSKGHTPFLKFRYLSLNYLVLGDRLRYWQWISLGTLVLQSALPPGALPPDKKHYQGYFLYFFSTAAVPATGISSTGTLQSDAPASATG